MKLNELRPGKSVYLVHAFGSGYMKGWIEKVVCTTGPEPSKHTPTSLFVGYEKMSKYSSRPLKLQFSVNDMGIIPNRYNHHRAFFTGRAAQRYLDRIQSGGLTLAEREKEVGINERRALSAQFDAMFLGRW